MGETRNLSKEKRENLLKKIDELRNFFNTNEDIDNKERQELLNHLFDIEKEITNKKYGLVYEEHEEEIDRLLKTHIPVLTEEEKLFIDNGGQMNFILEGDNLASLKLLEKTHKGKIDVIYIDPPYNTGNKDFIYNDNFIKDDDTYSHSKWISFIFKRLQIAYKVLKSNGIIFISIDDNELFNLKNICDDIFGENNFLANIMIKANPRGRQSSSYFAQVHDYLLVYRKSPECELKGFKLDDEVIKKRFKNIDENGVPYEEWELRKRGAASRRVDVPNLFYPIYYDEYNNILTLEKKSKYIEILPYLSDGQEGRWRWGKDKFNENLEKLYVRKNRSDKYNVYERKYLEEKNEQLAPTIWDYQDVNTELGTEELKQTVDRNIDFNYPKPVGLLKRIISLSVFDNAKVLDFFAGSGTTGQAVLELNKEDGGNRKFILCTNTEATEEEPKKNIARDITYQRMKTVITGKRKDKSKYSDGLAGSLKYMKVDFIETQDKLYEDYQYELESHMKELLELQYGIDMNNSEEYKLLLTEDEKEEFCEKIIKNIDKQKKNNKLKKIFIGNDILYDVELDTLHEELGVEIVEIPASYYEEV